MKAADDFTLEAFEVHCGKAPRIAGQGLGNKGEKKKDASEEKGCKAHNRPYRRKSGKRDRSASNGLHRGKKGLAVLKR